MATEIDGLVSSLHGATDVTHAYATVDRWNREGRTRDLLDLAAAVEKACDVQGAARFPYEAVGDHVEEVLALTTGEGHLEALFELLRRDRVRSVQRPRPKDLRVRAVASRLGHGQPKEALCAALERAGRAQKSEDDEVLACWMHEVVLRGTALDGEKAAVAFRARLAEKGHPLAAMPLALLPSESEAPTYMPMYGANAISNAVQRLEQGPTSARTMPPPADGKAPAATRVDDGALEARLGEAVEPWCKGSNGTVEAKVFRFASPIVTPPGRWLLRGLPLECLEGDGTLHAERTGRESVWGALFAAAANGGAYSSGLGGAYGRKAAWTSLAALVDAPADASPEAVDARAKDCMFLMFRSDGGWFHDIAWDIGALAVRADGETAAVLAATDTD